MLIYLGISALVVAASTFLLLLVGEPLLLAVTHLVLAAAILPLIFGAIAHFVPVLTRSAGAPRSVLLLPLLLQVTGGLAFLHFSGNAGVGALHAAAGIALLVTTGFAGWLVSKARRTLGKPHPGWRWYLAAVAFLAAGLLLVPAMYVWPALRQEFRLLHLHLNTLGFVGLTAIGTLQVLLPTVLSGPDADATARLQRDLPLALLGVLATGIGAAFWYPLSIFGAMLLLYVCGRIGFSWLQRYGAQAIIADGASAALLAAMGGLLLILVFGVLHAVRVIDGHDAVPAFMVAFLLPLVTGALSQLFPVWRYPGRRTPERERMRDVLVKGGAIRAVLFVASGVFLALGHRQSLWLTAVGMLFFVERLVCSFRLFCKR